MINPRFENHSLSPPLPGSALNFSLSRSPLPCLLPSLLLLPLQHGICHRPLHRELHLLIKQSSRACTALTWQLRRITPLRILPFVRRFRYGWLLLEEWRDHQEGRQRALVVVLEGAPRSHLITQPHLKLCYRSIRTQKHEFPLLQLPVILIIHFRTLFLIFCLAKFYILFFLLVDEGAGVVLSKLLPLRKASHLRHLLRLSLALTHTRNIPRARSRRIRRTTQSHHIESRFQH